MQFYERLSLYKATAQVSVESLKLEQLQVRCSKPTPGFTL
jgi:hypothetical protein